MNQCICFDAVKSMIIAIQINRRTKGGDAGVRMARKRTQEY